MWIRNLALNILTAITTLAATPAIRVIAPTQGTMVASGGMFTVEVKAASFSFESVFLAFPPIGLSEPVVTPPYRFKIRIPSNTPSGKCTVEAVGVIEPDNWVTSDPVTIDVEKPDAPQTLRPILPTLTFDRIGKEAEVRLEGVFADGVVVDLTHSKFTKYLSASPSVASTDADGNVTARGPGTTLVTIQHRDRSTTVRVTVEGNEKPNKD
jgi:hypothetical protein